MTVIAKNVVIFELEIVMIVQKASVFVMKSMFHGLCATEWLLKKLLGSSNTDDPSLDDPYTWLMGFYDCAAEVVEDGIVAGIYPANNGVPCPTRLRGNG